MVENGEKSVVILISTYNRGKTRKKNIILRTPSCLAHYFAPRLVNDWIRN